MLVTGLVLLVTASFAGCGDSDQNKSAKPSTDRQPSPEVRQPVPNVLTEVESAAEDTVDFAREGNRPEVIATTQKLRRLAQGRAAATLRRAGVADARIRALQDRSRRVTQLARNSDPLQISLAANQVSALMPEFYARYSDPVPPDVLELDYLDREVQLRSRAGDADAARAAAVKLSAIWPRLRARLTAAGGAKVALDYGRHVAAVGRLAAGRKRRALQKEASHGLAVVDLIENVFRAR